VIARWLVWLAPLLTCCSRGGLPDYAAPKGAVVDATALDSSDVIGYRQLTRADFRGQKVPPEFAAVADRVGAATCGQVRTTPDTAFFVSSRTESPSSKEHHWIEIKKLAFIALMDRRCSWWNDKVAAKMPAYVLEHEQIHFALYELGARQLNASADSLRRSMMNQGSSQRAVETRAREALNVALTKATERLIERNRDFDQDTSLGYRPERQRQWLKQVTSELRDTQRFAGRP